MQRLNEAMTMLEQQLEGDVDVARLASVALTSEYHFRRMFTTLAGMSLSEYVRRRRMTLAAPAIVAGEERVLEVAQRYGYASGEAFARAFRSWHGIGPEEARLAGAVLRTQPRLTFHLTIKGSADMDHRIIEKDAFRIVGLTTRAPLIHEGVNPVLQRFSESVPMETNLRLKELSDQEPHGILAVTANLDDSLEEGTEFDYWHGVATSADAPDGLDALEVPAGAWLVFRSSGAFPQTLQQLWPYAYTEWFPSNPWRQAPGPSLVRMQLADDHATAECELWLPIEPDAA